MDSAGLDVVILGGGQCEPDMREFTGCEYRSQVSVRGSRLGDTALNAAKGLGRTIFVGPEGFEADITVAPGSTFTDSLRNGLDAAGERVMVVTADLPLLKAEHLRAFIEDWGDFEGIAYAVCSDEDCQRAAPGLKRTTLRFLEGRLTGGNVVGAPKEMLIKMIDLIEQGYAARKDPVKLARLVGGRVMTMLLASKITPFPPSVLDTGREVGKRIGVPIQVLVMPEAEIATDVDSLAQLQAVEALQI